MATAGVFTRTLRKIVEANPNIQRKLYEISYFPQLGLMRDDCVAFDHKLVKEAILRLPKEVREERQFRIIRATTLSAQQKVLPKSEWMTIEEDRQYITEYIEELRDSVEEEAKLSQYLHSYRHKSVPALNKGEH